MFPTTTARRSPHAQKFGPASPALIAACQAALAARAATAVIRPIILGIQRQILAEGDYQIAEHWLSMGLESARILEPSGVYEMEEQQLPAYYAECEARYRAAGYEVAQGECPLAIAENGQVQAELAFGLGCKELRTGIDPEQARGCLDIWKDYLALMFNIMKEGYLPQ